MKTLTENQAVSLPLGREARPFSNPKAKPAWVSPKLFNRVKKIQREQEGQSLLPAQFINYPSQDLLSAFQASELLLSQSHKCCWLSSSHDQLIALLLNVLNIPGKAYMVLTLQLLFVCRITAWVRCIYPSPGTTIHCKPSSAKVSFTSDSFSHSPLISRYPFMLNRWQMSFVTLLGTSLLCSKVHLHESIFFPSLCGYEIFLASSRNMAHECLMLQLNILVLKLFSSVPL